MYVLSIDVFVSGEKEIRGRREYFYEEDKFSTGFIKDYYTFIIFQIFQTLGLDQNIILKLSKIPETNKFLFLIITGLLLPGIPSILFQQA